MIAQTAKRQRHAQKRAGADQQHHQRDQQSPAITLQERTEAAQRAELAPCRRSHDFGNIGAGVDGGLFDRLRSHGFHRERGVATSVRSEEHTSELQSLMRISYAVFCLNTTTTPITITNNLRPYQPTY